MEDLNQPTTTTAPLPEKVPPAAKKNLLILHCILLSIGNCGGPLILRLYFIHRGHRIWLITIIQTVGWPFILIILIILYFHRHRAAGIINNRPTTFIYMRRRLFFAVAFIGVLTGIDNYLYSYGIAHLPISTYALINATRLVFMAVFAFILVKQKFTAYSINAVVLLTVGSAVLALQSRDDRPSGEKKLEYVMGFVMTVAAAALYGLVSPLVEVTYNKAKQVITYTLVLEVQMMMCLFATVFCTVGMIFNNDFKVISREAEDFGVGKIKYYVILSVSVVLWQCFFLGAIGVIFYGSSLLLGVIVTIQIPVTEILAVIFYNEKFKTEKGVALVLSLWGFISYFYGEYKYMKPVKDDAQSVREVV
ncbi:purine permease 1-like [Cynara cardunculus var. scolymus]|uniref:Probable purine permease n=1 Tax=Cynara cardunculus var. scolymus TaxID=59895 RepID=A0A118JYF0_CYNCS|nr:purine permease 1-like [Cynara cardunculus var. scolymus]KVH98527.1 protein of unknown function DUF250 [Cynara cardunculus var. scolymus]